MDALGTNCWSETCPELKLQSGEALIGCTKETQYNEDIGTDGCELGALYHRREMCFNLCLGLAELPGGAEVA